MKKLIIIIAALVIQHFSGAYCAEGDCTTHFAFTHLNVLPMDNEQILEDYVITKRIETKKIQYLVLSDGRQLSYCIYGNLEGIPVFYFHGFPGCHLELELNKLNQVALDLNIQLIAVNRPGYYNSDFIAKRTLLDWPDDITELANSLKFGRYSVLGLSGGGPYAIACALKNSDRIEKVGIVSGMSPFYSPTAKEGTAMLIPKLPVFLQNMILKGMRKMLVENPDKFISNMKKNLPEADLELIENPEYRETLLNTLKEALRLGHKGATQDAKIYKMAWGFDLATIQNKIYLWHGEEDMNVKIEAAQSVANQLPDCSSMYYSGEGHLSLIYNNALEILKVFSER